jgi:SPP1 family predicted phage head-tail adaptor
MLSDAELEDMQDTQDQNLPETVYVQAKTAVSNSAGGQTESWSTIASVKGRIGGLGNSAQEREIAGRMGNVQVYKITLPAGTDVDENKQLQINGRQFKVGGVLRKSQSTALRVVCAEVR